MTLPQSDFLAVLAAQENRRSPQEVQGIRFALYGRMSTQGFQDAATSRAWQRDVSQELVAGVGSIVAEFFDLGVSRRWSWHDRPEAAALLSAAADPERDFDAVVVGEYERAFHGDQFREVVERLNAAGVAVWLPEAGGPVELDSPVHEVGLRPKYLTCRSNTCYGGGMGRPKSFDPDVVIAQAMETFWTKGYADTSPADLAEATGVAKGSLYHSFGSKRQLFGKALDLYGRMHAERAEEFLSRPGTAKERIRVYFVLLMDADLDGPVRRGCLAQNTVEELGGRDTEATRAAHRMEEGVIEVLAARIEQGQRDGDVARNVDARAQALFLQNTLAGLRVMAKTFDRPAIYRIIDTALAGL